MTLRSCLCSKRYFCVLRFYKPQRRMLSLVPEIKKQPLPATLPQANKTCFYQQLQQLPSKDIYNVFINHPDLKQARVMFKEASSYWNKETLQKLMLNEATNNPKYHWWKLDLFKALVADYRITHNIDIVLDSIPLNSPVTTLSPLYNAILRASVKQKRLDHTRQILAVMKERQIAPDIASYNIIMGSQLKRDQDEDIVYQELIVDNNMKPNQATFNMLMKHACDREDWVAVKKWLDKLIASDLTPTEVTARILFKAFVQHPSNIVLTDAFEQVMHKVELKDTERFVNIGVSALLEANRLDSAFKLLQRNTLSSSNRPYNLLIQGLCHQHEFEKAQDVLNRMIVDDSIPKPDIVSFTMLIQGIIRSEKIDLEKITDLYQQMIDLNIRSNSVLESVLLYGLTKYNHSDSNLKSVKALFELVLRENSKTRLPRLETDRPLALINVYNIMMDFYFLHYHENKKLKEVMPKQPFQLLKHVIRQDIKPTVTTLNILVRGSAIFNHDLNTAERMVELFKTRENIEIDERTLWYLTKCAYQRGEYQRGREWIARYEKAGHTIKGTGLLALRSTLMKYHKDNVQSVVE